MPKNLIEQEVKILSQGMKEDELNKNKKSLENQAIKRIKTGLILNAYGEKQLKGSKRRIETYISSIDRILSNRSID